MRAYGRQQAQAHGDAAETFAAYHHWVRRLIADQRGGEVGWLNRIAAEVDHVRAVLHRLIAQADGHAALEIAVELLQFWMQHGHFSEGIHWLEAALDHGAAIPQRMIGAARYAIGALRIMRGQLALAHSELQLARSLAVAADDPIGVTRADIELGYIAMRAGAYANAQALFDSAYATLRDAAPTRELGQILHLLGTLALRQGKFGEAETHLQAGVAVCRTLGYESDMAKSLNDLGCSAVFQGDFAGARPFFEQTLRIWQAHGERVGEVFAFNNLADVWLQSGDPLQAARMVLQGFAVAAHLDNATVMNMLFSTLAPIAHVTGRHDAAARLWGIDAHRAALAGGEVINLEQELELRQQHAARAALGTAAYDAAWTEGYDLSLDAAIALAQTVAQAITSASSAPTECAEPTAAPHTPRAPQVRVEGFGAGHVWRGEHRITANEWKYAKAREMWFYLLTHGPHTKEQIGVALWPDASTEQLSAIFRTTLYHLRQALGDKDAIVLRDRRYGVAPEFAFAYDVAAFNDAIGHAQLAQERDPACAITLLTAAHQLYQGDFLSGTAGEWIADQRRRLQTALTEASLLLGQLVVDRQDFARGLEIFRAITQREPFVEAAHRGIMRCYVALGESGQALLHYQQLRRLLHSELGAAPDPQTTTLARELSRQHLYAGPPLTTQPNI
jgi:DNA-binding SARP family transcriptional activator